MKILVKKGELDNSVLLVRWSEVCDNISIWDYTTVFTQYSMPVPNFDAMLENVRFFADNNVSSVMEQGAYNSDIASFPELRAYILAKILWDPYMSEEEYWGHIDDFLEGFYGPGWTDIRGFIDYTEAVTEDSCFDFQSDPDFVFPYMNIVGVNPSK